MRKIFLLTIFLSIFCIVGYSNAEIIFQDDFESHSSDWNCGQGTLQGWTPGWTECGGESDTFGKMFRMGPGYESNNALYHYSKSYPVDSGTAGIGTGDTVPNIPGWGTVYKLVDPDANFGLEIPESTKEGMYIRNLTTDNYVIIVDVQSTDTLYLYSPNGNPFNIGNSYEIKGTPDHNYRGCVYRWLSQEEVAKQENPANFHHRWYMKMPTPDLYDRTGDYQKMWRYNLRESGYSGGYNPEIYLQMANWAEKISTGEMALLMSSPYARWDLKKNSEQMDGRWHCHEIRLKMNTFGNSDGIIQYWFDGILEKDYQNISFNSDSAQPLGVWRFGTGVGNSSGGYWDQTEWSAIGFDNVVTANEYIGPVSQADTTSPVSPSGLIVS
jgi:hypothetical protein